MTKEHEDITGGFISRGLFPEPEARSVLSGIPSESKIVAMRLAIEERRTERIAQGLDKAIIIFQDTEEQLRRRSLPTLSGSDIFADVRYDEAGNLYPSWYEPKETALEGRRRYLVNSEGKNYIILPERKRKEDYLDNLPKKRPVVELILGESVILEEAIRQQQHILDGYQPGTAALEMEFARLVIGHTEGLALRLLSQQNISREDLAYFAHETGRFLESSRLYDPRDPRKRKILDKFLLVGQLDASGRANYLGSLGRIFAAHTAAIERLAVGGLTVDKFVRNLEILTYLRGIYRWRFDLAASELEMILQLPAFSRRHANRSEREAITDALTLIVSNNLATPKVNPYLRSARWSAINIVGCKEEKKEINREILGEKVAKKIFSKKPATRLIREGNFTEAEMRVRDSIRQLRKTNKDYEDVATA